LRTILRNKAQALEATAASTRALRERMNPENKKRFDDLVRVRSELASRYTRGPRGQTVAEFQTDVDKLAREADTIDAEISKESAAYRHSTKAVTIESIAESIPEDAALVEFVQYRHYSSHFYSAASERDKTPRFMAYVLRHNGEVLHIQLPVDGFVIDEKVAKIRKGLQDPDDKKVFRELSLLHDIIFIRLLRLLPGVKHLLISPDGDLSLIPFGALLAQDGHFLGEKYNITYLSSGRDLLRYGEHDRKSSTPMLVANPDYDAPGESDQVPLPDAPKGSLPILARAKFSPLPGTAEEAEAIRHIVPDPQVKLQRIATETALKQASGPKILHIATHGFFLDDHGKAAKGIRGLELEVPSQALPTIKTVPFEDDGPRVEILNPMFLSGLALAGANVRKGQTDDGILTAYEASALDLAGTELVVLSACETGVGSRVAREGVRGLRRALVLAGAETQVMSLWQVDDEATRDLMTKFYQNMYQKGLGRGEAMREAQMSLFAQPARQHPFYWASFIVSGDWTPLSGTSSGTSTGNSDANGKSVTTPRGGAKGCGCRLAADDDQNASLWIASVAMALVLTRRRRRKN
jgi:MYXO-CTERM domain-containing protein